MIKAIMQCDNCGLWQEIHSEDGSVVGWYEVSMFTNTGGDYKTLGTYCSIPCLKADKIGEPNVF